MNLKLLNSLEKDLGKTLRSIEKDEFLKKFVKLNLAEKYLQSEHDAIELLDNLDLIAPQLKIWTTTMRSKLTLRQTENDIEECFTDFNLNNDKEVLKERLSSFVYNDNVLVSMSGIVCSAIVNCITSAELAKVYLKNIDLVQDILNNLDDTVVTYDLKCDILDLVIQCKEYLRLHGENIGEISWLGNELDRLHEFEFQVFEQGVIPEVNIPPEALGLIDITRLKRKED